MSAPSSRVSAPFQHFSLAEGGAQKLSKKRKNASESTAADSEENLSVVIKKVRASNTQFIRAENPSGVVSLTTHAFSLIKYASHFVRLPARLFDTLVRPMQTLPLQLQQALIKQAEKALGDNVLRTLEQSIGPVTYEQDAFKDMYF